MERMRIEADDIVVGVYVHSERLGWLRAIEKHPQVACRFKYVDGRGDVHDFALDPTMQLDAFVPDIEEAMTAFTTLARMDAAAEKFTVEPLPPRTARAWAAHLRLHHGVYTEPSLPIGELKAAHASAHAQRKFAYPHIHEEIR